MNLPIPQSLLDAGAQEIAFLSKVTSITGTDATCLQALDTSRLNNPFTVRVFIGGFSQWWTCRTGDDATDVPNGVCQAGDHSVTGNVWYQTNP